MPKRLLFADTDIVPHYLRRSFGVISFLGKTNEYGIKYLI